MAELRQRRPVVPRHRKLTRADKIAEREAQEYFKREVLRLDFGKCVGTDRLGFEHECTGDMRAHHCVKQQTIRAHISTLELDEAQIRRWLWTPDIGATACDGLHDHHHDGTDFLIPLEWLPARVIDFCEAGRIKHLLLREHPPLFADGDRWQDSGQG